MRLFLAARLPDEVRERIGSLQKRLRESRSGWRWTRPEGIHLTLRFLGEVDEHLDGRSREAWRVAAARVEPFRLRLGGLGRFPERGAPRVLWIGAEEVGSQGRLARLVEELERGAREAGFEAESRPFRAHLTLARAARGRRAQWVDGEVADLDETIEVDHVVLYRSELRPEGARYTALDRFDLGAA